MIVLAGIIFCNNKLLIAQRKKGKKLEYLWEFAGGKLEENETMEQCLKREIMEEFGKKIKVKNFFASSEFENINLHAYLCECDDELIPYLDSHEQYKWICISELGNYQFCPADIPIIKKINENLHDIS